MILRRPMFRRGGSAEGGITSGLSRPGYNRGRVVNPGGYAGSPTSLIWSPEERKEMLAGMPPRPKSSNLNDFLINFGLNMASASPTGNVLQTAAAQAKEPFAKFQERKAYEQAAPREEEIDLLKTFMTAKGDMLSESGSSDLAWREKNALRLREAKNAMVAHNNKWNPEWNNIDKLEGEAKANAEKEREQWYNEKSLIDGDLSQFEKESEVELEMILGGREGVERLHKMIEDELLTSEYSEGDMIDDYGNAVLDEDGEVMSISEFYTANPGELQLKKIERTYEEIDKIKAKRRGWKYSQGGRAGYQRGALVEQEDVNIQTPRGDVSMQETVEEDVQPDQLSYEELRSRLPVEITDDIVRLLVSSASALGDFAQIQTQQDVDNFNAKYGVNLVLPSEA
jgi:hypothetical protein